MTNRQGAKDAKEEAPRLEINFLLPPAPLNAKPV
jgi:hypothetical protein